MISSFFINNFKSFTQAEMPLAPLTLLIGANASGKSNLLEAIRILAWLAKGSRLDDLEKSLLNADSLVRGKAGDLFKLPSQSLELGCQIYGVTEGWDRLSIEIRLFHDNLVINNELVFQKNEETPLYQVDNGLSLHTEEISVMYNNFKKGRNKPHITCSNRQAIFYQLETPGRFNNEHLKAQKIIPMVVKNIRENLRNVIFLDPHPSVMRDYSYAKDDEMKENGQNLSSVLYKLSQSEVQKAMLLGFIRSLPEQDIKDISFIETDRNDVMVRLIEFFGNRDRSMDAPLLSDGTLRVLAVGATLLSAPEGSLVIIEEIDNGVHPSRAHNLIKQIREIVKERKLQVLLSSHNPAMLDALPDDALGDVLCCYRDLQEGDSRVTRLRDLELYPELVAQGPLGRLMTQRILDRFLKDKTTAEQRKQNALDWLRDLQDEVSK
ncbi:MAG: AAA family ATPase [Bacillota bacterium]|jgi:predicted ATPase